MIRKYWQTFVLWGIALGLFLIPNIFWGDLYIVGGDDARLYYLYPLEYLKNFSFNVMSGNTLGGNMGYFPVSFSVPIAGFLFLLRYIFPFLHTQFIAYGLILFFGFIFFYKLLRELMPEKSSWHFVSAVAASLFYIFSPYITRTFLQHQVISIYLLAVVPGCLYFFATGVKRKQMRLIVASALVYSLFSSTVLTFPWFLPVAFTLVPFLGYLAWQHRWYFWKASTVFFGVTFLYNSYWIIHFVMPLLYQTGELPLTATLTSETFQKQNNDLITALVYLNSPVNQMINHIRTGWGDRVGVSLYRSLGALYLVVILFAGMMLSKVKKRTRALYIIAIIGIMAAMLFITPNFGNWNLALFQFFNDHVPFFGMFRNMYDKFALAMAFNYALVFFVSLVVLGEAAVQRVYRYGILIVVLLYLSITTFPYIRPVYRDAQYSTRISGKMNQDFLDLTAYLKNMETSSRFAWLPMTFPGYVYIGDEQNPNHFYTGLSPLQFLSQKSDIAGFYGIQTQADPELNWKILELLKNHLYEDVGRILAAQNIGYIIINREQLPAAGLSSLDLFDFMELQTPEFQSALIGKRIRDFGSRYSLYAINEKFFIPTVSGATEFKKLPNGSYAITISEASVPAQLVLLEPYNRLWQLRYTSGNGQEAINRLAYGYGNAWEIDQPGQYRIEFWPRKLVWPAVIISAVAAVGSLLYMLIVSKRK